MLLSSTALRNLALGFKAEDINQPQEAIVKKYLKLCLTLYLNRVSGKNPATKQKPKLNRQLNTVVGVKKPWWL